jgi:nucleoside 2-deoxyribosyltransferase
VTISILPRPRIYLAGPDVFFHKPVEHGERLKKICAAYGIEGMFPMDNKLPERFLNGNMGREAGMWIYRADVAMMDKADACVANMTPFRGPSMDSGTCFEMGYITAQKKPLFGYTTDGRSYDEKVVEWQEGRELHEDYETGTKCDKNGHSVEGFQMHDNLMMVGGVTDSTGYVYSSFEDAVKAAAEYFKKIGKL